MLLLVGAGLFVLIAGRLIEPRIIDALVTNPDVKPAADDAWQIATRLHRDISRSIVVYGIVIIAGAWLAGATRIARALRELMAYDLRARRAVPYGAFAFVWLLLVLWGPTPALREAIPILGLVIITFIGLEAIRRQTIREFPDVPHDHARHMVGHWVSRVRHGSGGASSGPGLTTG